MKSLFQFKTDEALSMGFESWDDLCNKTDINEFIVISKVLNVQWAESFIKHRKSVHESNGKTADWAVKACLRVQNQAECEERMKGIRSEHPSEH